ncbi:19690_t:CDS:2 [Gigaspora margarita]|uniref:19690_t:CDS:1 n=1 Tax=Gigaspora margarita TaxID=4874 RepID=A0ABM8VW02_GIGMA|nr:19690_t:CDS:2 [Gigaspora margarita]
MTIINSLNEVGVVSKATSKSTDKEYEKSSNEVVERNSFSGVESSTYESFDQLIKTFLKLKEDIVTIYQKAEYNKHLCNFLTKRVYSASAVIKDLEIRKYDNVEFFTKPSNFKLIEDFLKCILDIKEFITDISQLRASINFSQTREIAQSYKELSTKFDEYMTSLNFEISYQYYQNMIQFLQKANKYTEDLKGHIDKIREDNEDSKKLYLELQYEANLITEDLDETEKLMHDMFDSKTSTSLEVFTNIKNFKNLNSQESCKDVEASIVLNPADYKPNQLFYNERFSPLYNVQEERFFQQVAILKELKSDYFIMFYGVVRCAYPDDFSYYLVIECISGNLREYYKANSPLDWNKKFEFAIDICRGIAFLHAAEMCHNITSESILITDNHKAKIFYIGTLHNFKGERNEGFRKVNFEYFRYMAPENLGALLWEIAEEEVPYTRQGMDFLTIQERVVKEKYRESFSSHIPKIWQDIVYAGTH